MSFRHLLFNGQRALDLLTLELIYVDPFSSTRVRQKSVYFCFIFGQRGFYMKDVLCNSWPRISLYTFMQV